MRKEMKSNTNLVRQTVNAWKNYTGCTALQVLRLPRPQSSRSDDTLIYPPTARLPQSVSDATYVPEALSQPDTEDGVQVSSHCLLLLPRTSGLSTLFAKQLHEIVCPDGRRLLGRQRCPPTQIVLSHKFVSGVYEL